jgi:MFS family permease
MGYNLPIRYLMVFWVVLTAVIVYITRQDLNLAMVSMVEKVKKDDNSTEICQVRKIEEDNLWTPSTIDPFNGVSPELPHRLRDKKYHWDQSTQGYIFGGFFWSYIIFQVPSGMLVQEYGGYSLIVTCLFVSAILSGVTPFVTDHVWLLIILRFTLGCFQAGVFPAGFDIVVKWTPLKERSVCFALLDIGAAVGTIITFYTVGLIQKSYGWPSLFFIPSIISCVTFVMVAIALRSNPQGCSFVSSKELKLIRGGRSDDNGKELIKSATQIVRIKTPFRQILTCKPVLAVGFFKFSLSFAASMFSSKVPVYLDQVMHETFEENGHVNAYLNAVGAASLISMGALSDFVINRNYMQRTKSRKCFAIISGFGSAVCIASIPFVGCDVSNLHLLMYLYACCAGFSAGSDLPIASEMSLNFPAILYSLFNMCAMSSGFFAPAFAGLLLDHIKNQWLAWSIIYYSTGGLLVLATIGFMILGTTERQPFDFCEDRAIFLEVSADKTTTKSNFNESVQIGNNV